VRDLAMAVVDWLGRHEVLVSGIGGVVLTAATVAAGVLLIQLSREVAP